MYKYLNVLSSQPSFNTNMKKRNLGADNSTPGPTKDLVKPIFASDIQDKIQPTHQELDIQNQIQPSKAPICGVRMT
jgi:hypothetical protein